MTHIVAEPQSVRVQMVMIDANTCDLHLNVASKDPGKVTGQQGRSARSLRIIMRAIGVPDGYNLNVEIVGAQDAAQGIGPGDYGGAVRL